MWCHAVQRVMRRKNIGLLLNCCSSNCGSRIARKRDETSLLPSLSVHPAASSVQCSWSKAPPNARRLAIHTVAGDAPSRPNHGVYKWMAPKAATNCTTHRRLPLHSHTPVTTKAIAHSTAKTQSAMTIVPPCIRSPHSVTPGASHCRKRQRRRSVNYRQSAASGCYPHSKSMRDRSRTN